MRPTQLNFLVMPALSEKGYHGRGSAERAGEVKIAATGTCPTRTYSTAMEYMSASKLPSRASAEFTRQKNGHDTQAPSDDPRWLDSVGSGSASQAAGRRGCASTGRGEFLLDMRFLAV